MSDLSYFRGLAAGTRRRQPYAADEYRAVSGSKVELVPNSKGEILQACDALKDHIARCETFDVQALEEISALMGDVASGCDWLHKQLGAAKPQGRVPR